MNKELIINARNPKGELGSKMIEFMNESHVELSQWGINHININDSDIVLDIGCGGGANVKKFSEIARNGRIYGLDYSELSVEKSIQLNKLAINKGKVEIIQGSVSKLPFKDETFDIITAFKTVYFWPNFIEDLKEVNRVLKPNGLILICNGAIGNEDEVGNMGKYIKLLDMKIYSEEELSSALATTNFFNISTFKKEGTNWICATANKSI